jgi:acetate kinase
MAAALGGIDGLVFTGGIGENDAQAREEIVRACGWLGLELDEVANRPGGAARRISREGSPAAAWIVPTDEERMIARHTAALLSLAPETA